MPFRNSNTIIGFKPVWHRYQQHLRMSGSRIRLLTLRLPLLVAFRDKKLANTANRNYKVKQNLIVIILLEEAYDVPVSEYKIDPQVKSRGNIFTFKGQSIQPYEFLDAENLASFQDESIFSSKFNSIESFFFQYLLFI